MKKRKRWFLVVTSLMVGIAVVYVAGGLIASAGVCHAIFGKRASSLQDLDDFPSFYQQRADIPSLSVREDVSFPSGDHQLVGHFYRASSPKGLVISAHGLFSQSDGDDAEYQAWFLEEGYHVFAIDLTASGASEGTESKGLWQSSYDVLSAYRYVQKQESLSSLPLILTGHSWGAYGILASLSLGVKADYAVAFSAFDMPLSLMKYEMERYTSPALAAFGSPMFDWYMAMTSPGGGKLSASLVLSSSTAKVLCVQGGEDVTVPPNALSVYGHKDEITNPDFKTYFSPHADHRGVWRSDASRQYVKEVVEPEYQIYCEEHPDGGSKAEQAAFRASLDLARSSELDVTLFNTIRMFLNS